jgi:homoaconitase/3-isopropylmalate dehydratase large subunit
MQIQVSGSLKPFITPKDVILAMIKDDTINPYQMTAAIRVFKEKYSQI